MTDGCFSQRYFASRTLNASTTWVEETRQLGEVYKVPRAIPIVGEKRFDAEQLGKRRDHERPFGNLNLLRLKWRGTSKLSVSDLNAIKRAKN